MNGFLDEFMETFAGLPNKTSDEFTTLFTNTISTAFESLGEKSFRPQAALNAAVFDAVMIGLAERLRKGKLSDFAATKARYRSLLQDAEFQNAYTRATADEDRVTLRIEKAISAFENIS
jgi:hypothetical protein